MKPSMPTVKVVEDVFTAMNEQPVDSDLNEDYVEKLRLCLRKPGRSNPLVSLRFLGCFAKDESRSF